MAPPSEWIFPDLGPVAYATLLFALFAFIPGYVAGWLSDVFQFRGGSAARRMALSIPLSVSLMPIAVHLAWRFGTIAAVWRMFDGIWVMFTVTIAVDLWRAGRGRMAKGFWNAPVLAAGAVATALWMGLALGSLLDLRIEQRRYFSVTAFDYMTRIPMASAIAQTPQLPAENPYFNPGRPTILRYHYFWPMMCGLAAEANRALDGSLTTRDALTAGTVWAGLALLCVIALYVRFFTGLDGHDWRNYALAFGLLGVTGLDILPTLLHDSVTFMHRHAINSTVEWWNEQITGWLDAMLWVPHHIISLVCVLTAFLLLWAATELEGKVSRPMGIILGASALASAAGSSIYVTLVFGIFVAFWIVDLSTLRGYGKMMVFLAAGVLSLMLATPFLHELTASAGTAAGVTGRLPVTPTVRGFGPVVWLGDALGSPATFTWRASSVALRIIFLPLNYFLELGFFFYVAVIQWRRYKGQAERSPADRAAIVMLFASVLACTFLRSNVIANNDLGWRGFMIAQFVLLLWAVGVLRDPRDLTKRQRRFLSVLMGIGIATTAYDLLLLRAFMPALDARPGLLVHVLDPDGQLGARTYALHQGYDWIRRETPASALIQPNPDNELNYQYGLYAERRVGVMTECDGFSGRAKDCRALRDGIWPAFSSTAPADSLQAACRVAPLSEIVVQDSDPVWQDRESWIWKAPPAYANRFMRIFTCPAR